MTYYSFRKKILRRIINCSLFSSDMRISILRKMGVEIGHNTSIGRNFFLSDRSVDKGMLKIGNNIDIAANVTVTIASGPQYSKLKNIYQTVNESVVIEDDVWIGNGSIILSGVTIGKCSIIGAGCVVTKDVPPYSVVSNTMKCKTMPSILIKKLNE